MNPVVYQGAVAPEAVVVNVTPGASGVDLSTVTAASFSVRRADGVESTWSVVRSNQTATTLTCTHTMQLADTPVTGRYVIYALLTIPSGTVRTAPRELMVRAEYET